MRYTWYENYPNNRLIVGGVDLSVRFRMILNDGYTLNPPAPKTYTVDIPGGNGVIDLTESLMGDVVFSNRSQQFTFWILDQQNETDFEEVKTELANFLQGKYYDYQMTMDPGYTYHGRFSIGTWTHQAMATGILGEITIDVDADPYKSKDDCIYTLNATGGREFTFVSGRRKVHPLLTCDEVCTVNWQGEEFEVPVGTYRLNSVLFEEGVNTIYLNSHKLQLMTWRDFGESGTIPLIWESPEIESSVTYYYYISAEDMETDDFLDSDGEEILDSDGETVSGSETTEITAYEWTWDELLAIDDWTRADWGKYTGLTDWDDFAELYPCYWTKTVTTYDDGTETYSFVFTWSSSDEEVSEIESLYSTTTDNSWPTTWLDQDLEGVWYDEEPALPDGVYLWTRTVKTYSDGTKTRAYAVQTPYGIESTSVSYAADDDGWDIPESTWSSSEVTGTGYPFIWTRTQETDSQGCLCTSYDVDYTYAVDEGADLESSTYQYICMPYNDDLEDDELVLLLTNGDADYGYRVYDNLQNSDAEDILTSDGDVLEITVIYQTWASSESEAIKLYKKYYAYENSSYVSIHKINYTYTDGTQTISYIMYLYSDEVTEEMWTTTYNGSSSGIEYPEEGWVDSESEVDEDSEFLWEKVVAIFSDGRSVVTQLSSMYKLGEEQSIYLVDTEVKYQTSYSGTEATGTSTETYEWTWTTSYGSDGDVLAVEYTNLYAGVGANEYRWDELQLLYEGIDNYIRQWNDVDDHAWEDLTGTWDDVDYRDSDIPDTTVVLEYEWEDI